MRVALVVMPFAAITRPSLSVGLLQANLRRADIECESVYLNLVLGDMLGASQYRRLSSQAPITALAGEWAFSQVFFGQRLSTWDTYRTEVLDDALWGAPSRHDEVRALLDLVPAFLEHAFAARDWGRYELVGFTSTFEQTMPSLCLARMIRARHADTIIAIGGANFEAGMGRPYLDEFDCLDLVSTGEADTTFPRLCSNVRDFKRGRAATVEIPRGFLFRESGRLKARPSTVDEPVDLERSPTPDYDDYFSALRSGGSAVGDPTSQWLPVEASRGCWWGEKVHCTFCGLNGETMRFRAKSARRVVEETDELVARYGARRLQFADNIMSTAYCDDLLPLWAARGEGTERFFEIKSNLTRDQLALMRRAGVATVQAGIESLSDETLRVMGKGVSGAQNVALLRWCSELGIDPLWNIIYAFPKERLADYASMLAILRQIVHLPPPDAAAPIRMDRFSPNFTMWREHGFTAIAPMAAYRHVFPFPPDVLGTVAYYFRYEHPQFDDALREGAELERFIWEWHQKHGQGEAGMLLVERRDEAFIVKDTRFTCEPASHELDRSELAVLMACDRPVSAATAIRLAGRFAGLDGDPQQLETALSGLVGRQLIAKVGNALVTLACLPAEVRDALTPKRIDRASWPVMLTA